MLYWQTKAPHAKWGVYEVKWPVKARQGLNFDFPNEHYLQWLYKQT